METMSDILSAYHFTAEKYVEEDGSITLSLSEIDLIENDSNEKNVRLAMGRAILEYSEEYYNNYELYSHSPNWKNHIPYIFMALITDDPRQIGESIHCHDGKS